MAALSALRSCDFPSRMSGLADLPPKFSSSVIAMRDEFELSASLAVIVGVLCLPSAYPQIFHEAKFLRNYLKSLAPAVGIEPTTN